MNIIKTLKTLLLSSTLFLFLLSIQKMDAQHKQLSQSEIDEKAKVFQHLFSGTSNYSNKLPESTQKTSRQMCGSQQLNRSINGECNNINNQDWGKAEIPLLREVPAEYGSPDPLNSIGGMNRANPRSISNAVAQQDPTVLPSATLSSFVFSWGQFIDHDIGVSPSGQTEVLPIPVSGEPGDLITVPIPFRRTIVFNGTGVNSPRAQENEITAWIDGSNVYGSDQARADWLRLGSQGKLRTSAGNLLPYNTDTREMNGQIDPNAPHMDTEGLTTLVFVAGDSRANEQSGLTALHTLFVREHNRLCDELINSNNYHPINDDETIYQEARKRVAALIACITFNEFLPALGVNLSSYPGYDNTIRPDLFNGFSTAAFRLGHTMVTKELLFLDNNGGFTGPGTVSLIDAFFTPSLIASNDIDPILKGLSIQFQEEIDIMITEELRTFLFTPGPGPGSDLASLNIQRGRDHGLADYNAYRSHFTGTTANSFADITSDLTLQGNLASVYTDINDIDLWVGLLSEDKLPNAEIGATLHAMLTEQFSRLRDGDYYFYKNDPSLIYDVATIEATQLSDVIKRNTTISNIQDDVFKAECNVIAGNCCSLNDSLTLVKLYNETNGANWVYAWDLYQPMSTWHGVTLNERGCVIKLDLSYNGLYGNLPEDLCDLKGLTHLDLGHNHLSGSIPACLATISTLSSIHLNNNQLTGGIPEAFSDFPSLVFLYVNNNKLSGCYDTSLSVLCNQLNQNSNNNACISDGNNFDFSWTDFCYDNLVCESVCEDYMNLSGNISGGTYHTNYELHSEGTIQNGDNVEFKAGERIHLQNNFSTTGSASFKAAIENCE